MAAGWHGVGGRGRWQRPFDFPIPLRGCMALSPCQEWWLCRSRRPAPVHIIDSDIVYLILCLLCLVCHAARPLLGGPWQLGHGLEAYGLLRLLLPPTPSFHRASPGEHLPSGC